MTDYKNTIRLPQTSFSLKANLSEREPERLNAWEEHNLTATIFEQDAARETFILHDGPPYANGHLHLGHALNKILKDIVNRSQYMMGKNIYYVPGWDCHGLPIEWEVESQYRKKGKNKDDVPINEFRKECRQFAKQWLGTQRSEFKRLGILGDWDNPYSTMDYTSESAIYQEIVKFALNGSLYRGFRPVMWSVVEKTALADAEVEYHDVSSPSIYVKFPLQNEPNTFIIIWTTTPWTLPGNRAIAYNETIEYGAYQLDNGETYIIAKDLAEKVKADCEITSWQYKGRFTPTELQPCLHPLHVKGYDDFIVPLIKGEHVTLEQGTGFVHTAPGHGMEDFHACQAYNIPIPETVNEAGTYYDHVPLFAGLNVLTNEGKKGGADKQVIEALRQENKLVGLSYITHSYPHSWRSKAPLIFRTTQQWFISLDKNNLRDIALKAIEATTFYPEAGKTRLYNMIVNRPDWCVSRQRAWGVPIALFLHKKTKELLIDVALYQKIAAAFAEKGADCWFEGDPRVFLENTSYNKDDYEPVMDILDVWFESGASHAYVLENNPKLHSPADLYLEGSDQHRGWFHHALLEGCGTRGFAPFKAILTHGFALDQKGHKMSKSLGNVIAPQEVVKKYGADVLRLWVASANYFEDLRIGEEILLRQVDVYRRLRNTLRFLLGNLHGFSESELITDITAMPELEQWVLSRLYEIDIEVKQGYQEYTFHKVHSALHLFASNDLSSFYLDIRKDCLYCDDQHAIKRRSARTALYYIFQHLCRWLAPILCFTIDEAYHAFNENAPSILTTRFLEVPKDWHQPHLIARFQRLREARRLITTAIEAQRSAGIIHSSLEAHPHLYTTNALLLETSPECFAELCITSQFSVLPHKNNEGTTIDELPDTSVIIHQAQGEKCSRCWMIKPEVGANSAHLELCARCVEAV